MSLEQRIAEDIKTAMKAKDAERLSVLRMLKTAITNRKIAQGNENLSNEEVQEIVQKQAKQRRESIESFKTAGRQDLVEKEQKELRVLESYLPQQLSDEEIRALIQETASALGVTSKADTGRLMKDLMPKVKGRADGRRVNEILGEILK